MSFWVALRRGLVEQTVWWQTRPHQVWSTYGGQRRRVTVVWPLRERDLLWYRGLRAALWLAVAAAGVLASAAIIESRGWAAEGSEGLGSALGDADPTYGIILFATFIGLTMAAMTAVLVVHLLLRLYGVVAPRTVEGVALRQRVQVTSRQPPDDGDGSQRTLAYAPDVDSPGRLHQYVRYYLALDVGADTALVYRVHQEWYDEVNYGDVVRLTLVPATRKVRRVEVLSTATGQPSPSFDGSAR